LACYESTQLVIYFWFRFCSCWHRNWARRNKSNW